MLQNMVGYSIVPVDGLVMWKGNPVKRSEISTDALEESISNDGILQPLTVIGNLVIDGNRRLRIANKLGISRVHVISHPKDTDPVRLAVILNTTGKSWDVQSMAQIAANHSGAIEYMGSKSNRGLIRKCMRVMGSQFKKFVDKYSVSTHFAYAYRAAKFLEEGKNDEFIRKTAWWCGKHSMTTLLRDGMYDGRINKKALRSRIENDEPLTIG